MFDNDYPTISGVIERIVYYFINVKQTRVPDMDQDDIRQEIRIKCIHALQPKVFDPTKSSKTPYAYLRCVIHNFLYNLKRGTWTPNNPPCVRCDLWDRTIRKCNIEEKDCRKMAKYRSTMKAKADLRTPIGFDEYYLNGQQSFSSVEEFELDEFVSMKLPDEYCTYYHMLKRGEIVPEEIINELKERVLKIIEEGKD